MNARSRLVDSKLFDLLLIYVEGKYVITKCTSTSKTEQLTKISINNASQIRFLAPQVAQRTLPNVQQLTIVACYAPRNIAFRQ